MTFQHPQVSCRYSSSCLARLNAAAPEQTKFQLFMPRPHKVDHIKRTIIMHALHFLAFSIIFLHKSPYTKHLHTKMECAGSISIDFGPKIHHLQQGDDSMTQSPSRLDEALWHGPRTMRAPEDSETLLSPTATHV